MPSVRMLRYAKRLEAALKAHDFLPKRRSDLSLIGDLAALESRVNSLRQAVRAVAASPRSKLSSQSFHTRMIQLVAEVLTVFPICRDLERPLSRLIEAKGGPETMAAIHLIGAAAMMGAPIAGKPPSGSLRKRRVLPSNDRMQRTRSRGMPRAKGAHRSRRTALTRPVDGRFEPNATP
jgi:hypothetical protein